MISGLAPVWLFHNARFRWIYGGAGLLGVAIGYLWGKANRAPSIYNLDARVRRHLVGFALCLALYIALGFAFQDWIPVLFVGSPGVYESGTFIRYAALTLAAVWGMGFLILGVTPVQWTVNCFRDRHWDVSEGGTEIAPTVSIVDPEGTARSLIPHDRS